VVDNERGATGSLSGDPGEVVQQLAPVDKRRTSTSGIDGSLEPLGPARLARPDQARKPGRIVLIVDVKRVKVDPCPPYNLRYSGRQRCGTADPRHDIVGASGSSPAN
jgi:hypothetical protein